MFFKFKRLAIGLSAVLYGNAAMAGGPLGIDSKLNYDNQGIWKRSNQKVLEFGLIGGELAGAFWEGSNTRLGRTFFQSIDASLIGAASSEVLKRTFRRLRPSQSDDPGAFFKSGGRSFPSGEVTSAAAIITPFVLEYGHDHPIAYALELVPLYDAEARMKVHGHWQSDVLAGWALGTLTAYYAHTQHESITVGVLPRGLTVGWKTEFR